MANEVKLTIKVGDDGTLDVVARNAKKAKKATDDLTDSTNRGTKASDGYHKGQKGVAGATANSTKAFSKMRDTMSGSSGLVAAYATLAANVFALTALFGTLSRAAQVQQLATGMTELGRSSGLAMGTLAKGLTEATGNAISFADAMRAVANVTSAGLDPATINRFGEAAKNVSIVLGRDVGDSFDRLTRGVTKLEPELLDELGLFIRVDEASRKFAQTLGKSAGDLTNFEKRLAFANETLTQAEEKFGTLDSTLEANPYSKLAASFTDLSNSILRVVNEALKPLISFLSRSPEALIAAVGLLGGKVIAQAVTSLVTFENALEVSTVAQQKAAASAGEVTKSTGTTSKLMKNYSAELAAGKGSLEGFEKAQKGATLSLETNRRFAHHGTITMGEYRNRIIKTGKVMGTFARATSTATIATGKLTLATALEALQQGKLKLALQLTGTAFKQLGVGILLAAKSMFTAGGIANFFAGALATLRAVTVSFVGVLGFLGAALAVALPILSIVALAFTVGADLIEKFKRSMRSDEENALIDRLERTKTTFDELQENIQEVNLALEGNSDKIKTVGDRYTALFNILSTIRGEYNRLEAIGGENFTDSQRVNLLNQAFSKSITLQKAISAEVGYQVEDLRDIKGTDEARAVLAKRILETTYLQTSAIAGLKDATEGLSEEADNFMANLQPKTAVTAVNSQLQNLVKELDRVKEEGANTGESIETVYEKLNASSRDILGISVIHDQTREAEANLARLEAKQKSLIKTTTQVQKIQTSRGVRTKTTVVVTTPVDTEELKAARQAVEELQASEQKVKDTIEETIRTRAAEFEANERALIASKQKQKVISNELNQIKEVGALTKENIEAQIEKQNELNSEKISANKTEIDVLQTIADVQEVGSMKRLALEARIEELKSENLLLDEKMIEGAEVGVEVAKTQLAALQEAQKAEKAILKVQEQQLSNRRAQQTALTSIKRSMLEVNAARQGRSVTATEEAKFAEENLAATIQAESDALQLKMKGIDLEYDLLEAQFELLHAEIKLAKEKGTIGKDTADSLIGSIEEVQSGLTAARALAHGAAGAETAANIVAAVANSQVKTFEAGRAVIEAQDKITQESIKNLQNVSREQAALVAQNALLADQEARLRADLANETDKLARLELEGKLEANINQQIANRIKLRAEAAKKAEEMGGTFAGNITGFAGSMMDQFEKGGVFAEGSGATTAERIEKIREGMQPLIEDMKKFGPDGELVAAVAQSSLIIGESISSGFLSGAKGAEAAAQKFQAIANIIGSVNNIIQASFQRNIDQIDKQIAAEKKRDGKSAESVARINAMEKKKEAQQKKAFELNKKMMMAQVVMSTAAAVASNVAVASAAAIAAGLAAPAVFAGTLGMLNAITIAIGAAQLALIAGTSFQGGGSVGSAPAASAVSVGERSSAVDMAKSQGGAGELAYFRGGRGEGGPENFRPAFAGYRNRAEGGNTAFMVGEQGPEMFVPQTPGRIIPSDDVNTPTPINANINISAIDASGVEDVLMNQRGNIISMIREAANAQGNTFLEEINVAEL